MIQRFLKAKIFISIIEINSEKKMKNVEIAKNARIFFNYLYILYMKIL